MTSLFLVRNLISIKTADAISDKKKIKEKIYILPNLDLSSIEIMRSNINKSTFTGAIIPLKLFGNNFFLNFLSVIRYKKRVKEFYKKNKVTVLYVTNPLHYDTHIYYDVAKSNNIEVFFFEEGTCFYRLNESEQYSAKTIFQKIKKNINNSICLYQGYDKKPNGWYAALPFSQDSVKLNLKYNYYDELKSIKKVFLSRPASEDFNGVGIDNEIEAILKFNLHVIDKPGDLFIKFHPRELNDKRIRILSELKKARINVFELKVKCSSEDVIYSMDKGVVCGYETATLAYTRTINRNIKIYSVAEYIADKDRSNTIKGFIKFYKENFPYIEFI
ncbi:TPA: polysialyltransferase family glycosyltransferase [Photobacterium damselae]